MLINNIFHRFLLIIKKVISKSLSVPEQIKRRNVSNYFILILLQYQNPNRIVHSHIHTNIHTIHKHTHTYFSFQFLVREWLYHTEQNIERLSQWNIIPCSVKVHFLHS